jgi:hypothetical protein
VAQGDALAAVARHRPHDLGYDLAVVSLRVVDGGVDDHIDGHARCLLLVKPDWAALWGTRPSPSPQPSLTPLATRTSGYLRSAMVGTKNHPVHLL